jgi:hypothetical protein
LSFLIPSKISPGPDPLTGGYPQLLIQGSYFAVEKS